MMLGKGSLKRKDYKEALRYLEEVGPDVTFTYNGKGCALCNMDEGYVIGYDGEGKIVQTIQEVKTTKWFNGKSLDEIYSEVEFEW